MFKRSLLQSSIIWGLGVSLLAGFLLLVILLVVYGGNSSNVTVGPIQLMQITRTPLQAGGSTVEVAFGDGFTAYFLFWVLLGCATGFARGYFKSQKPGRVSGD